MRVIFATGNKNDKKNNNFYNFTILDLFYFMIF